MFNLFLLNFVEGFDYGYRYKDYNCFFVVFDVNFFGRGECKLLEFRFEFGDVGFEVEESLGDLLFDFRGGSLGSVGGV